MKNKKTSQVIKNPTDSQLKALALKNKWFAKFVGSEWVSCGSQEVGAVLDMNRAADYFHVNNVHESSNSKTA